MGGVEGLRVLVRRPPSGPTPGRPRGDPSVPSLSSDRTGSTCARR